MSVVYSDISLIDFVITVGNAGDQNGQYNHHGGSDDLTLDIAPGGVTHGLESGNKMKVRKIW